MKRVYVFCNVLFAVTLLVGCAGHLQKPEVSLVGVNLVGLNLIEQSFLLKLRIRNPNDVDLPVTALDFDVELNNQHFAKGCSEKPVNVPRQGEAPLEVTTVSRFGPFFRQFRDAQRNGQGRITYRIYGNAELEGWGRIPFERSGEIAMGAGSSTQRGEQR